MARARKKAKSLLKFLAAAVLLVACYAVFLRFRPPRPITIGADTTIVVGPLDAEGQVDFEAALNDRLGEGVAPESNAVVLAWQAMGPRAEGWLEGWHMPAEYFQRLGIDEPPAQGDYFVPWRRFLQDLKLPWRASSAYDRILLHDVVLAPWSREDYPVIADWLAKNEGPLALMRRAAERPDYFDPRISAEREGPGRRLFATGGPIGYFCQQAGYALATRAMLRLAENDPDAAWKDLLTIHRLARLCASNGTTNEGLVGFRIDRIARQGDLEFLRSPHVDGKMILAAKEQLLAIAAWPPLADAIDLEERLKCLDLLQAIRKYGINTWLGDCSRLEEEFWRIGLNRADWNETLRTANRWLDRQVEALRDPNPAASAKALSEIEDEIASYSTGARFVEDAAAWVNGQNPADLAILMFLPAAAVVNDSENRAEQERRNLVVAFALEAFRRERGAYPRSLAELIPDFLTSPPQDLFTRGSLVYQPEPDGYLLYSLGPNGKDDGGQPILSSELADDIPVKMPRDPQ